MEENEVRHAEEALRASELRYRRLFETAQDGVLILDAKTGQITDVNPFLLKLLGYSHDEFIGMRLWEIGPFKDIKECKLAFQELQDKEYIRYESLPLETKGGRSIAVEFVSNVYGLGDGIKVIQCNIRDITDRKQAEENLRTSQERLAAVIGSAMDTIITVDKDQRIIVFNAAAEKIFGCPAAEAIGQALERFLPERSREAHRNHVQLFGSTGVTSRSMHSPGVLYGRRTNGEEFPLEATISRVTIGGEKLYTVILRDITQRKVMEAALMRSEKLATVGRLAATVAHEINNPLEAVTNLLYLAEHNPSLDEAARGHLRMAGAELMRAAHIARQTLSFSKGGAAVSRFRPADVLESVLALLESKLRYKAVTCEQEFAGHAEIRGVESEIRQVFWNLLSNSLEAVPSGGRIRLRVSPSRLNDGEPGVRVTVADNGGGISADHMPHLFEPFFTTKAAGNGLGLWITSEIVKKHGGSLRVRSRNGAGERTGTVFSIFLPAEATSVAA